MPDNRNDTPRFAEDQRLRQKWLWSAVIITTIIAWVALVRLALVDIPDGTVGSATWWLLALLVLVGIGLPLLLAMARLRVLVYDDRIELRYRPLTSKTIRFDDITRAYAREYNPIMEYGGWGIRFGFSSGRAYNAFGNKGVQLELKDGKKILIGSQRANELADAIDVGPSDQTNS